jgi:hypothetical protein
MIYILTPYQQDFRMMCEKHNLPYYNGRSSNDVFWINSPLKLLGRRLHPDFDQIIKGDQYHMFDPEVMHRMEMEIAIRNRK